MDNETEIIGYRALRRIDTDELVTPFAPIYSVDWPYQNVAPNQSLLRYMDFWKFEDLLKTRTLYFCRVDQYAKQDDPLEGALSPQHIHGTSASDVAYGRVSPAVETYEKLSAYREIAKASTFINCWHINDRESQLMWDKYTTSSDSVVVITSAARLAASLKTPVFGCGVKYVDLNTPRTEFGERSLFFYKDKTRFEFEQEFRLLIDLAMLGGSIRHDHPDDLYRRTPVNLSDLIYGINAHPQASRETKNKIGDLLAKYLPQARKCEGNAK